MSEIAEFRSTHGLDFEVAPWMPLPGLPPTEQFSRFRIGTCHGLWRSAWYSYDILAIDNDEKGNGHFEDVLEWFENSCKRDERAFRFLEVWNKELAKHLVEKRGFIKESGYNYIKGLARILGHAKY